MVIAYGGVTDYTSTTVLDDTWGFDGCTWHQIFPTGNPGPRFNTYLAQSPTPMRLVTFGGSSQIGVVVGATWEFDTEPNPPAWINMTPSGASPPARQLGNLVYDSWRGRTVLFGGSDAFGGAFLGDTWEWDGTSWFDVTPAGGASPTARAWHAMTFDSARGTDGPVRRVQRRPAR